MDEISMIVLNPKEAGISIVSKKYWRILDRNIYFLE